MTNNDILRRIRYTFDLNDSKMIEVFAHVDCEVSRSEVSNWLKPEDDESYASCSDELLANFMNGFIVEKRGKKDDAPLIPEKTLNNNIVLRKLKIALDLHAEDVLDILALAEFKISKHELSAFLRKAGHKHFRKCKDQVLRNFLQGMQLMYRDSLEP